MKANHAIFAWSDNYATSPLPKPFETVTKKEIPYFSTMAGGQTNAKAIRGVIKALLIYAALEMESSGSTVSFTDLHVDTGIGARSNSVGETIYVERRSQGRENCTDLITYNSDTGATRGSVYNAKTKRYSTYSIKGTGGTDGTSIFLGMLPAVLNNTVVSDLFTGFKEQLTAENWEDAYTYAVYISYCIYHMLCKSTILPTSINDETSLPRIPKTDVDTGKIGPSKGKVIAGAFHVFKVGEKNGFDNMAVLKIDPNSYQLSFEHDILSEEEELMVPKIPDYHVVSEEETFILSELERTWPNPQDRIRTIMLRGGSASGKSHLARIIAARLHRPAMTFSATPNMDESSLIGCMLPVVSDSKRDSFTKSDNMLLDKLYETDNQTESAQIVADSLGLPSLMELYYDPSGAYTKITGTEKKEVDSSEVYNIMTAKITGELKRLVSLCNQQQTEGVSYKYYESPLVRSIKNGYYIEIEEANIVKDPALFTSLNSVFEPSSPGILETPYGQVMRHPDFMAVYTLNPYYQGCRDMNFSVVRRCDLFLTMNNPAPEVIMQRVEKRVGLGNEEMLKIITDCFLAIDNKAKALGCQGEATLTALYKFAYAIKENVDVVKALHRYLINMITCDEDEVTELYDAAADTPILTL